MQRDAVGMESLLFLLGAVLILSWVLGVIGFVRAGSVRRELEAMRGALNIIVARQLALERAQGAAPPQPAAAETEVAVEAPAPVAEPVVEPIPARMSSVPEVMPAEMAADTAAELPPEPPPAPPRSLDLETLLTQRLGVWVGSAALLLAGVFLVRYAVEQGWLGPAMRCFAAFLLGAALLAGAEWLRRRPAAENKLLGPDQAPAGLAAGGSAVLFGAAYGVGVFYALVPPGVSFVLMAAAAMVGLLAALRFGPLTAAVGVACAYLTPALVETTDPDLPGLFAYLLFVTAACLALVRYTAWVWLGWAATAGGVAWVILVASFGGDAMWAPATFVVLAAALNLGLLPPSALDHPQGRRLAWVPFAALAVAALILEAAVGGAWTRWAVFLLAPLAILKGVFEPRLDRLPWLAALAGLLALLFWALPSWTATGEAVTIEGVVQAFFPGAWAPEAIQPLLITAACFAAFHAAIGLFLEGRTPNGLRWSALVAGVPVLTLAVAYAQTGRFQSDIAWATVALVLAAALTGTAALGARQSGPQRAGVHATGAVAALLLGCTIILHDHWLTLAFSLFLPALAWIAGRAGLPQLRPVAAVVAVLVLVRLLLNWHLPRYGFGTTVVLNGLIAAYAVPALAFWAAATMFRRQRDGRLVGLLESGAIVLAAAFVMLEIRHAATGGRLLAEGGFSEVCLDVVSLAIQAWAYRMAAWITGRLVPEIAWRVLGLAALVLAGVILVINPAITNAHAPSWALLCGYLLPAIIAVAMAGSMPATEQGAQVTRGLQLYALAAGFVWIGLQVRAAFHPGALGLDAAAIEDAEMWCWSGGWLVYGAGLMAVGMRLRGRGVRLAALAIIALVTAKVFVFDMSGLTGLWRVVSFLGLGLALIGLGAVYRRFVLVEKNITS